MSLIDDNARPAASAGGSMQRQVPFVIAVLALTVLVAVARPSGFLDGGYLLGLGVTALATAAYYFFPWKRFVAPWVVFVAITDIVAVAILRDSVYDYVPGAGLLILLPVIWLGSAFSVRAIAPAIVGALFVTVFPYIEGATWPAGPAQWANILLLPIVSSLVVVSAHSTARQLRRQQASLARAAVALEASAKASRDEAAITRSVTDAVNASIFFLDTDHQIKLANRAMRSLLETVQFDPATAQAHAVYAADKRTPIAFEDQNLFRVQHGMPVDERLRWIGAPGKQQAMMTSSRRVEGLDGEFLGTVLVAHDVTELAEAIAIRDEFLLTVSHELRTPLTSILGYVELAQDANTDRALGLDAELEVIDRNAHLLLRKISDLIDAGDPRLQLNLKEVDLGLIVGEAVGDLRARAAESGLRLAYVSPGPVAAMVDDIRLRQAVDNLVSNAVKFTPAGGTVSVSTARDATGVILSVTDDGPGIGADEQRQLFERFFRSKSARKDETPGSGLGLSIVRSIVDAHGGTVTVASEPGAGSTFTIRIPVPDQP